MARDVIDRLIATEEELRLELPMTHAGAERHIADIADAVTELVDRRHDLDRILACTIETDCHCRACQLVRFLHEPRTDATPQQP